jgi:peptidoglycan/xylan/chitin deacetylase (PgdA/CDA1 family)
LTYHKLGPRPRHARIKGLYVSERLFARQLAELRIAGFTTPASQDMLAVRHDPRNQIVLTFDDGYASVLRYGLSPLAENGFHAIQFLVTDFIGKTNQWDRIAGETSEQLLDIEQIREWLAAGHQIGSHSLTHPFLTRITQKQAREEVSDSKKMLEDMFGHSIEYFCYPYGDWNDSVRNIVIEAGYSAAFTTTAGINTAIDSPFALKRFTARYPSRSIKAILSRLRHRTTIPAA